MGGLILLCAVLGAACLVLLIRQLLLNHRIRRLAAQVDGFSSGTEKMLDVALEEDSLARLHNLQNTVLILLVHSLVHADDKCLG